VYQRDQSALAHDRGIQTPKGVFWIQQWSQSSVMKTVKTSDLRASGSPRLGSEPEGGRGSQTPIVCQCFSRFLVVYSKHH